MYIIQTNTSIDNEGNRIDFQSFIYKISKQNWEEFKDYILSEEPYTEEIVRGTMFGNTKPSNNYKVLETLINDDFHLETIISYGVNNELKASVTYYMVSDEQFSNLIRP